MNTSHDSETPARGRQVITACALIHRVRHGQFQIFLAKRAATKKFLPNVYELPGGHIDFGEDLISGLQREIHEELGISITVGEPFAAFTYTNKIKGSHSVEIIYFATLTEPETTVILDPGDHSEYKWVEAADIDTIDALNRAAGHLEPETPHLRRAFEILAGARPNLGE